LGILRPGWREGSGSVGLSSDVQHEDNMATLLVSVVLPKDAIRLSAATVSPLEMQWLGWPDKANFMAMQLFLKLRGLKVFGLDLCKEKCRYRVLKTES
jgi:hypothetical protein